MRRKFKIGLGIALVIVMTGVLYVFYAFDPSTQPVFPSCPFLLVTGYQCPGCGSQRAFHSLLHLDFGAALKYNAFMVLALPYVFLGIYYEYLGGKKHHPAIGRIFFGRWSALTVLVLVIAYWTGRNLF